MQVIERSCQIQDEQLQVIGRGADGEDLCRRDVGYLLLSAAGGRHEA